MLNRRLYHSLKRLFPRVELIAENQKLRVRHTRDFKRKKRSGNPDRWSIEVIESGEEYLIDCPCCQDRRQRLSINHRWGLVDPKTGKRNLQALLHCYNEECQRDYSFCWSLYHEVYSDAGQQLAAVRGRTAAEQEEVAEKRKLERVDWPGDMIRIDRLAAKKPNHPAVRYLEERFFDPLLLGKNYQVSYCRDSDYSLARNRIVVPFFMKNMMVGWQCRYIGEWRKGDPPKYWTTPGMPRSMVAYGFDEAIKYPTVPIVEGPFDRISFGPEAIALLGKTMSSWLRRYLKKKLPPDATLVVMLDPNQDRKAKKAGKPHHIDRLVCQLRPMFKGRVVRCMLPKDTDPGSLEREYMIGMIKHYAKDQRVPVRFS